MNFDYVILHSLNSVSGSFVVDWVIHYLTENKILNGVIFIAVYWFYWFGGKAGDIAGNRRIVLAGLISCCVAIILARVMADVFPFRVRPLADPSSGFVPRLVPATDEFEVWSSFPSDKAAFVFALSFGLYAIAPRVSIALAFYSVIAICIPRIYLGIHYPSDILTGAAIGTVCGLLAHKLVKGRWVTWLEQFAERQQPIFYALAYLVSDELGFLFRNVRHTARSLKALLHSSTLEVPVLVTMGILVVLLLVGFGGRALFFRVRAGTSKKTPAPPFSSGPPLSQ